MKPVLAQYSARSKQKYIFRSNRILEIVGASANISNLFQELFSAAAAVGISAKPIAKTPEPFSLDDTKQRFESGELQMIELTRGGGNNLVMFDCEETFHRVNRVFTYTILKEYPGLLPMCVCVPVTENYDADYKALNTLAGEEKNRMSPGLSDHAVPFARMDRTSFQAITGSYTVQGEKIFLTAENAAKRRSGIEDSKTNENNRLLDDIVTNPGEESLLAVVHADGNNMGVKIRKKLGDHKNDYDYSITALREFNYHINEVFVTYGIKEMNNAIEELKKQYSLRDEAFTVRQIVADGDDCTFICNERLALPLTEAYLKAVNSYRSKDDPEEVYSSCAGICIFHSHYPFARAYDLAEQACDSAKEQVHKIAEDPNAAPIEECWIDFHYIHSGVNGDLNELREIQQTGERMMRPWCVIGEETNEQNIVKLYQLSEILKEYQVTRTNIKALGSAWEISKEEGMFELERVYYRAPKLKAALGELFGDKEGLMKAIYDLYEVYDLWFSRRERIS